jgi:hypothetical protein
MAWLQYARKEMLVENGVELPPSPPHPQQAWNLEFPLVFVWLFVCGRKKGQDNL